MYGFAQTLITQQGDATALTGSTAPTSLLLGAAKYVIPAGNIDRIGHRYRMIAHGRCSNIVTTPGTLTFDVRFTDSAATTVIVANGGAVQLNAVAKANLPFWLEWDFTVRSVGSAALATLMHQGFFTSECVVGSPLPAAGGAGTMMLPTTAPAVGTGFNSSLANTVDLFGTFSLNNANSIQVQQYCLIDLG